MTIFLLGPDPQGQCCDCSQRSEPCVSCATCNYDVSFLPNRAPYENITDAEEIMNQYIMPGSSNCLGYSPFGSNVPNGLQADIRDNTVFENSSPTALVISERNVLSGSIPIFIGDSYMSLLFSAQLYKDGGLQLSSFCSYIGESQAALTWVRVLTEDGAEVAQTPQVINQQENVLLSIPSDGQYLVVVYGIVRNAVGGGTVFWGGTFSAPHDFVVCKTRVPYYDGGETKYLTCDNLP